MKFFLFIYLFLFAHQIGVGQPNCLMLQDSTCVKACQLSIDASKYQGSKYSQELFDKAIEMCPGFAYAYYEKSVPYLKHGFLREWKSIIDKAVELEPKTYLINRGCNQIQFFRNYKNGLKDLDQLYELIGHFNIGYNNSGEYHVQMIRAIAYRKIGQVDKSIEIMEQLVNSKWYSQGLYDLLHLGVSYLEAGKFEQTRMAFDTQIEENNLAEVYFYYAQIYERENKFDQAIIMLNKAKELYEKDRTMSNNYYHYIDKIFFSEIEEALARLIK